MRHALIWFLLLALPSCGLFPGGRACPDIGCGSGLSVTIEAESGAVANGEYTLQVVADGRTSVCALSVPTTLPDGGTQGFIGCGENGEVSIRDRVHCVERRTADAVSQACTPIPNSSLISFTSFETPERIEIKLRRDDQLVLDETLEPAYVENFPAGPECGGGCLQAEVALTVE